MTTTLSNAEQGINPRTGNPVGQPVPLTTAEGLEHALAAAEAASRVYRNSTPEHRAALLTDLARRLTDSAAQLVPLAAAESGLPVARLEGELARTAAQLQMFAQVVTEGAYLEVVIEDPDPDAVPPRPALRRMLEPLGPVLVYAASNFPFAFSVLGGDSASALAAGAPVIVKTHPAHPGLSAAVVALATEAVAAACLPAGVFSAVVGDDNGVNALRDPRMSACGFTGSTVGGRFLQSVANERPEPIPFYGELGSVNPAVVTSRALGVRRAEIIEGFISSLTMGTGQFCTKPGLLLAPSADELVPDLAAALAAVAPAPMLTNRIAEQFADGTADLAAAAGIDLIAQGGDVPERGSWATPRLFATSVAALLADPAPLRREYFGPAAVVVEYDDVDGIIDALQAIGGSLTATLHTEADDDLSARQVLDMMATLAGRVIVNGWPTGVAVSWAINHGGPSPSTTNALHTSVGATAIRRWLRPVAYQSVPDNLLPPPLQDANPWHLPRREVRV